MGDYHYTVEKISDALPFHFNIVFREITSV